MAKRAPILLQTPSPSVRSKKSRRSASGAERTLAREGTRLVGAHVPVATWRELSQLRIELGVTMQALLSEAIDDVLAKHRRRGR